MQSQTRHELMLIGKIIVVVAVLAAFFFLGWLFALYDRHEQPDHASRYRELPEQRIECTGLQTAGRISDRYTLYPKA